MAEFTVNTAVVRRRDVDAWPLLVVPEIGRIMAVRQPPHNGPADAPGAALVRWANGNESRVALDTLYPVTYDGHQWLIVRDPPTSRPLHYHLTADILSRRDHPGPDDARIISDAKLRAITLDMIPCSCNAALPDAPPIVWPAYAEKEPG